MTRIAGEKAIFPFFGAESLSAFDLVGGSKKMLFFSGKVGVFPRVVDSGSGRMHHSSLRRQKS